MPTFLLQEFVDDLLPFLTALCNRSIQDGVLPPSQKRSILVPVLKCSGLDSTDPLNFRPIANVSFMSTIIEKIAAYQLTVYLKRQVSCFLSANLVFEGVTPLRLFYFISFLIFMGL